MSTISSCGNIECKHDLYESDDYMKRFCESLREDAIKIINYKIKKKMKLLKKEQE